MKKYIKASLLFIMMIVIFFSSSVKSKALTTEEFLEDISIDLIKVSQEFLTKRKVLHFNIDNKSDDLYTFTNYTISYLVVETKDEIIMKELDKRTDFKNQSKDIKPGRSSYKFIIEGLDSDIEKITFKGVGKHDGSNIYLTYDGNLFSPDINVDVSRYQDKVIKFDPLTILLIIVIIIFIGGAIHNKTKRFEGTLDYIKHIIVISGYLLIAYTIYVYSIMNILMYWTLFIGFILVNFKKIEEFLL